MFIGPMWRKPGLYLNSDRETKHNAFVTTLSTPVFTKRLPPQESWLWPLWSWMLLGIWLSNYFTATSYATFYSLTLKRENNLFFKKSKSDKQGKLSCSLVWSRSWLVSMAPSPAQMGRSTESLEGRKSTRIAERELTFFLQAGCIWNPGHLQHG